MSWRRRPWPVPAALGSVCAGVMVALTAAQAHAQTGARPSSPTWAKDIAPIVQERCEICHRQEGMAPMPLARYADVRPWVRSIKRRVETRDMPPWYVDKTVCIQKFANDRSLSDREIDLISRWVDAGAPQGDPSDLPKPKVWPADDVWQFAGYFRRPPDLIVKSPDYVMPAVTQDR